MEWLECTYDNKELPMIGNLQTFVLIFGRVKEQ